MTCEETAELMRRVTPDQATNAECAAITGHMMSCEKCRNKIGLSGLTPVIEASRRGDMALVRALTPPLKNDAKTQAIMNDPECLETLAKGLHNPTEGKS